MSVPTNVCLLSKTVGQLYKFSLYSICHFFNYTYKSRVCSRIFMSVWWWLTPLTDLSCTSLKLCLTIGHFWWFNWHNRFFKFALLTLNIWYLFQCQQFQEQVLQQAHPNHRNNHRKCSVYRRLSLFCVSFCFSLIYFDGIPGKAFDRIHWAHSLLHI